MQIAYKNMSQNGNLVKGFTLVELLIAISLIAILTGVLFSVINPRGIQAKARDSQRISDLAKIKVALENYFADNRAYPLAESVWVLVDESTPNITGLTPNYINNLPSDPKQTGTICTDSSWRRYAYRSFGSGATYLLATNMEQPVAGVSCPSGYTCSCTYNASGVPYYTTAD